MVKTSSPECVKRIGKAMATQMQQTDEPDERAGKRSRLIDVSPELRRRIRVAAAQRDLSVRDYIEGILEEAVPREVSEPQRARRPVTRETIERLMRTHEEVMHGRRFTVDSAELLNEVREERSRYLDEL
jgi:hypothetical protein